MKNIIIIKFILLLLWATHAQTTIPSAVKHDIQLFAANSIGVPYVVYFGNLQQQIIIENFADSIIKKYHTLVFDANLKQEILSYIKQEFRPIFDQKGFIPRPIYLKQLVSTVEDIYILDSYKNYPINIQPSGFTISPWDKNTYLMQLRYKNTTLPLSLTITRDKEIKIKLYGIPLVPGQRDYCFEGEYTMESSSLNINWIGTAETICPIQAEQKGNFILELAEAIARALKKEEITLWDASRVYCPNNQKTNDLGILKLFQQGKTWYESKGYSYKEKYRDKYRTQVNALRQYLLINLENSIMPAFYRLKEDLINKSSENIKKYSAHFEKFAPILIEKLNNFKNEKGQKFLSDFMAWLYQQNCALYSEILDLLFSRYSMGVDSYFNLDDMLPDDNKYIKKIN